MVSDLGSSIQLLIMPLYIIDIGGSAKTIGIFSFLYILPILIIFPFGGVIGDKLNRKKIMVSADVLSGIFVLILAYLSYIDRLNIGVLLIFQVFVSSFYGFFDPATKGILPQIVAKDKLSHANSLLASFRIIAGMIAPLIAVGLFTQFGITTLFIINGVSFLVSALSEMFIEYQHKLVKVELSINNVIGDLKEGIRFIKNTKVILSMCIFFFIINTLIYPLFSVVLPMFFRTTLDYTDTYYGYLQTALFIGALIGSLLAGLMSKKTKALKVLSFGIILIGVSIMFYAVMLQPITLSYLGNNTILYIVAFGLTLFLLYTSMMLVGIPLQTIIQKETPEDYMSRVFSIVGLMTKGGAPLGALVYGLIIDKIDTHTSVIIISIIVAVICFIYVMKSRNERIL